MKYQPLTLIAAFAALAFAAFGADTKDQMITKITGSPPTSTGSAAGKPPYALAAHALVGKDNTIAVNAWTGGLVFQGATWNQFATTLAITDPTANRTITLPNSSGTVTLAQTSTTAALTADNQAVTPGHNTRIQLTSDNATATNRTFTLSATGAIAGQIYVLIGPDTNQCEIAATGIQKLSATWSPTTSDTLTLLFDGTNFLELARSNN